MRLNITQGKWQQIRGKKRPHWGILTLDDLDKANWKHSQMITQLQAQYRADKEPGKDTPNQKSEDFSI
jgi:uncharacterized protein YjbJ (UPF0337 family)